MQPDILGRRLGSPFLLLLVALFLPGCGGGGPRPGAIVTGKVLVNGNPPLTGATITFIGDGNNERTAVVLDDGRYTIEDPPLGPVQVVIRGTGTPSVGEPMPGMKAPSGVPVPLKYSVPGNGLTMTVAKGNQTKHFELAP